MQTDEILLKRLRMRSWRRGTREMDLILGPYADMRLVALDRKSLDAYEDLLSENDHDLYLWISGVHQTPGRHDETVASIRLFHRID